MELRVTKGMPEQAKEIREEVFVREQHFTREFDEIDPAAVHVVAFIDGEAAATGRVFPDQRQPGVYTVGRVAVRKPWRGQGLGREIIKALEEEAKKCGAVEIRLFAQLQARDFYRKLGYTQSGNEVLEEDCPHVMMVHSL